MLVINYHRYTDHFNTMVLFHLGDEDVLSVLHHIQLFVSIKVWHFSVLGEAKPLTVQLVQVVQRLTPCTAFMYILGKSSSSRYCLRPCGTMFFIRSVPYAFPTIGTIFCAVKSVSFAGLIAYLFE